MFIARKSTADLFSRDGSGASGITATGDLFSASRDASHEVIYLKEGNATGLPVAIVPHDDDLESFFAEVATFHPDVLPLSSLCHVAEAQVIGRAAVTAGDTSRRINACIGASVAEVLLQQTRIGGPTQMPTFSAARNSLSFALGRLDQLYPHLSTEYGYGRWRLANHLSGMELVGEVSETIFAISEVILGRAGWPARPKNRDVVAMKGLGAFITDATAEKEFVGAISAAYESLDELVERISGPFDGRMAAFEAIVNRISSRPENSELDGVAIGYFANRVSGGSFAHFPVVLRLSMRYPSAVAWYGVFAGMELGKNSVEFVSALARKLRRDMSAAFDLSHAPEADISVDELAVLTRLPNIAGVIKQSAPTVLRVSLLPGVDIFLGASNFQEAAGEEESEKRIKDLLNQQLRVRDYMVQALRSLDSSIDSLEKRRVPARRGRK
jgi:hypothetical protein